MKKNNQISIEGGAIIGLLQAKTPLAKIEVNLGTLTITASLLGKYTFTTQDVISIELKRVFISQGIVITHNRPDYPKRIIFFPSTKKLTVAQIHHAGFKPEGKLLAHKKTHRRSASRHTILLFILVMSMAFWFLYYL